MEVQATARVVTVERQHGGRGHLTCCNADGCRRRVPRGLWRPLLTGQGLPRLSSVVGALSAHNIRLAARGGHRAADEHCSRHEGAGEVPQPW